MSSKTLLMKILDGYEKLFGADVSQLAAARIFFNSFDNLTSRKNLTGHVTGSALVFDKSTNLYLRIFNPKVRVWCYSAGGHIDEGEAPWQTAIRELREETGITATFIPVGPSDAHIPLIISAHPIPASEKKTEPAHWHYDLVYLFEVDETPKIIADPNEIADFHWVTSSDLAPSVNCPVDFEKQLKIYKAAIK